MNFDLAKSVLFGSLVALFFFAQTGCDKKSATGPAASPAEAPKTEVIVDNVGVDDVQLYIYTEGKTVPYKFVDIRARISGYLEQLFFESGAIVKEGDRLALIEQDQYQVALDAAKAQLAVSVARESLAKANFDRGKQLVDSNTITMEEFQSRQAEYQMAQASVELAKTSVDRAQLDLDYTDLRSPVPGKTSKNLVDIGNYISPTGAQAVLLSIAQLDPLYVDFKISDRQFTDLKDRLGFRDEFDKVTQNPDLAKKTGKTETESKENSSEVLSSQSALNKGKIDISLMTGVNVLDFDFKIPGSIVAMIDNQINWETGQVTLRAEVRNPLLQSNENQDYMIYSGQICRVRIPYEKIKNAVLIREEAILTDLDTKYVLTIVKGMYQPTDRFNQPLKDQDGNPVPAYETDIVKRKDIKIGRLLDTQMRIIVDGLEKGERYVVKGTQRARIGMEVKPTTLEEYNASRAAAGGTAVKKEKPKTDEQPEKEAEPQP